MNLFLAVFSALAFLLSLGFALLPDKGSAKRIVAADLLAGGSALALAFLILLSLFLLRPSLVLFVFLLPLFLLFFSFALTVFYALRQETLAHQEETRRNFFALLERS